MAEEKEKKSWENKSNNQIFTELKEMQHKHEKLKNEILEKYDELERIEKEFEEGNQVIKRRMKPE